MTGVLLGPRGNVSVLVNVVGGLVWGGRIDVAGGADALGVLVVAASD